MTKQQLEDFETRIRKVVGESLEMEPTDIEETSRFVEEYGGDSMLGIEILSQMERHFGIEIPEENLPRMTNLAGVRTVVSEIVSVQAS